MKPTLANYKKIRLFFILIMVILLVVSVVVLAVLNINIPTFLFIILIFLATIGLFGTVYGIFEMRVLVYNIDNHEVICVVGAARNYIIVDEQVVDEASSSTFSSPVLTHKLGDKQLEFSHKRLKVNGEMVLPNKK